MGDGTQARRNSDPSHFRSALLHVQEHSIRSFLLALVLIACGFTLYLTASFVLPIVVATMLALLLAPAVNALARLHVPHPVGAGLLLLTLLGTLGALGVQLAAPVQRWIDTAPEQLRRLETRIDGLMRPVEAMREATEKVGEIAKPDSATAQPREVIVAKSGASAIDVTLDTMVTILSTIMLLYFLLASGDLLLRKLVAVTPDREDKLRMVDILRAIQREIGRYFATITLVNVGLGTATGLALWALDMPTPLVWGVAVALLNFLPYIGPLIATVLLTAVSLLTFDSAFDILAPPAAFLLLNFLEDQLLLPFLFGRRFSINPVVIFVWVLFWAWMWGVGGLLLAVPMLVAVRICAERIPRLQPLAVILSRA
jgi:predicted PurR-regulated permease PerM